MLREKLFGQSPDLYVVSAQPAHVLYEHSGGMIFFQLGYHRLIARTVHCYAGYTVIGKDNDVGVPGVFCRLG